MLKNQKESVALSSVLAGFVLTFGKAIVGLLTGSIGILSEALHSLLDLVAAIMTYFAVKIGDMPADESHPYGHGKVESVSALIETGLLFLTSFWIIYEAVKRLAVGGSHVEATWYAFVIVITSIVIDVSRSRALYKVAKATNSQALEADALHFSSDIWSSAVVLLGLFLVRFFGIPGADAVAAIVVAFFVAFAGYRLGKRTIDVLIDSAPSGMVAEISSIAEKVAGVVRVERVRARPMGPTVFIDLIVCVNRKFSTIQVQEITNELEKKIKKAIPEADLVVHSKSVQLDSETIIESVQALALKAGLSVHDVVVDKMDGNKFISYDLEVPADYNVLEAHKASEKLESDLMREFGANVMINTHIEPFKTDAVLSAKVTDDQILEVKNAIKAVDTEMRDLKNVHDILVRKIEDGLFVSFHCDANKNASIEKVHYSTSRFEYLIRQRVPGIKRVVIHVEPA
ncbi:MAG: cation-efflux pump [Candidatus Gracilibacteria bacterium]